jgi:hypothetical protein
MGGRMGFPCKAIGFHFPEPQRNLEKCLRGVAWLSQYWYVKIKNKMRERNQRPQLTGIMWSHFTEAVYCQRQAASREVSNSNNGAGLWSSWLSFWSWITAATSNPSSSPRIEIQGGEGVAGRFGNSLWASQAVLFSTKLPSDPEFDDELFMSSLEEITSYFLELLFVSLSWKLSSNRFPAAVYRLGDFLTSNLSMGFF